MPSNLVIVDYGTGNLNSVRRSLGRLGVQCVISSDPADIFRADKIVLPGVGHFGTAMSNLGELNLLDALHEAVLVKQKPILGICLGMELMARTSEEGNATGLGWFDAEMVRFNISDKQRYKIPQMGWNKISIKKHSLLMQKIPELSEFYFAHSYYLKVNDESDILCESPYEIMYPSAIENGNIFGVQFHPEKSHDVGYQLLKNFVEL